MITIIGAGGVGGWLVSGMAPFINDKDKLRVVDFDTVEDRNLVRQTLFHKEDIGENKALALAKRHAITPVTIKIDEQNAKDIVKDSETIFLAVDNHYARMCIISTVIDEGWNGMLLNGSNEFDTASAWINGPGIPLIIKRYPELLDAEPPVTDTGCGQAIPAAPQVIHANQMAASLAIWLWRFWSFVVPYLESDIPNLDNVYPVEYRAARGRIKTVTKQEAESLCQ